MLLGNYSVLNRNTYRMVGNAFTNPFAQFKAPALNNFYLGEQLVTGQTNKSAFNNGYAVVPAGGSAWWLSPKAGGLSTVYVTGEGDLTANLLMGKALAAALTGSGTISAATLGLIVQLAAALTGSGTISAATLQAITNLSATLSGSGDISAAALSLIVALEADLSGSGSLTADLKGLLSLEADITVTGTGLTTANVGAAVLSAVAESGPDGTFTLEGLLRLIAAATAGEMSGGPGSPLFKALSDLAKTRISGTANSSGDRSAITYDPS